MKKQSNLSRLMGYAGGHKILTYLSWVLSVMSALLALVPFWYIWCIIHDILEVSPDFSQAENVEYIKIDRDKSTFKSHRDFDSEIEMTFKHF